MVGLTCFFHVNRFFPILLPLFRLIPPRLLRKLSPTAAALLDMQSIVRQRSMIVIQNNKTTDSRHTIFDAQIDVSVPPEERTIDRLQDEGSIVLLAGTETASVLTVRMFYLVKHKLLLKLREELKQVMPTPTCRIAWTQLVRILFLTRCVWQSSIDTYDNSS